MYTYIYYVYTHKYYKKHKITLFYSYLAKTLLFTDLFYFPTVRPINLLTC
jgi:hypothetical protein